MSTWSYDAIADVYATDMGQSMPFDDIGWYRKLCLTECHGKANARVLELGCGTGRILIELMRADIDIVGVDRSLPMLARLRADAEKYNQIPTLLQMDIAAPALYASFQVVLLPYSLITYLPDHATAIHTLCDLAALVTVGGCIVLDAFVPQPVASFNDFRQDYSRIYEDGVLERHKRISTNADGTHRIERIYRRFAADGMLVKEFSTDETIRPYTANDLASFGTHAGLDVETYVWDYGSGSNAQSARFASVVLRRHA